MDWRNLKKTGLIFATQTDQPQLFGIPLLAALGFKDVAYRLSKRIDPMVAWAK